MKRYFGLLGYPLSHSFSPDYFRTKFENEGLDCDYTALPILQIEDVLVFKNQNKYIGLNVTIPYKEVILDYLDDIDPEAQAIGAVNCIKIENNKWKGYNTDGYGFEKSLLDLVIDFSNVKSALILGNGGAAKAVKYILEKNGISYQTVSRQKGNLLYGDINESIFKKCNLIINTTPLGMYPEVSRKPEIPYIYINENYFLYDLVYNPENTLFLSEGKSRGAKIKNGFDMLILQADRSWSIWNHK